jgi:VPDSG-CTERM motif
MKTSSSLLLGFIAGLLVSTATLARADSYQFSYQFQSGDLATGTFNGTTDGNFIDNISSAAISLDGHAFTGKINYLGEMSFDAKESIFSFTDLQATGFSNFSIWGILAPPSSSFNNGKASILAMDPFIEPGSWSLKDVSVRPVPDSGSTIALLGTAVFMLFCLRSAWTSTATPVKVKRI